MSNATYHVRTRSASDRICVLLQAALDEPKASLPRYNAPNKPLLAPLAARVYVTGKFGVAPKRVTLN